MKHKAVKYTNWFHCTSSLSLHVSDALSVYINCEGFASLPEKRFKEEVLNI